MVRIVSHKGGSNNLKAVLTHKKALETFGFTNKDILRMVSHDGGSKNIQAINDNKELLKSFGCTNTDMVRITSHHGGSRNIEALKTYKIALDALGYTLDEILKIVSCDGGAKKIEIIIDTQKPQQKDFSKTAKDNQPCANNIDDTGFNQMAGIGLNLDEFVNNHWPDLDSYIHFSITH